MNEAGWLACTDPEVLLAHLRKASWTGRLIPWLGSKSGAWRQRKYRLGVCACCRRFWESLAEAGHRAVEAAEGFVDGLVHPEELEAARDMAEAAAFGLTGQESRWKRFWAQLGTSSWEIDPWMLAAAEAAEGTIKEETVLSALQMTWTSQWQEGDCCRLLRELFGNPFRTVPFDPAWRTGDVLTLAAGCYAERILPSGNLDSDRLSVLADALEDAGCTNRTILDHCRDANAHFHGCWVLDQVLGKC
jgi:hypothetical protein